MPTRFDNCEAELRRDTLAIFLFHGVIPEQLHKVRNYTRKHLLEEEFEICLRNLSSKGNAVSMPEALEIMEGAEALPPYAFVITFDDGFENNLTVAAPVLRRYRIPATFYVCSSFVQQNRVSWTDQIENAFEHAEVVNFTAPFLQHPVLLRSAQEKISALDAIRSYVKSNPDVDPYDFARAIVDAMGPASRPADRWLDQKLSWPQVTALAQDDLFEVGGHGHSHRILSYLTDDELRFEVAESIARVGQAIGRAPEHFSYPEGLAHCYSDRVIGELKAHGIRCCPTAIEGLNPARSDPFHLRRIFVV